MISKILDVTPGLVNSLESIIDVGGWNMGSIHVIGLTGQINTAASNDSGAIEGVSDGSARTAQNFVVIPTTDLTSGSPITNIVTDGIYKINISFKYLKIYHIAPAITISKVLVFLNKPI